MTSNELWNVNTLELPSTITAANEPSSSPATTLSTEIEVLEATRVTKAAEFDDFKSDHKDLETASNETKARLENDKAILQQPAAQTRTLLAHTLREKETIAKIVERIDALIENAAPLHEEIKKIDTQLESKVIEANNAREVEAMAALRSEVQLECHRSSGKAFIKAMKTWYKFSEWKSTNNNRNIGPQTEAILLVLFDIPYFFSRTELEVFLGYKSPNHNVDGALTKMVEEKRLVKANNKVGTEVYYLGNFGMEVLHRVKLPNEDARQDKYHETITIRSDNGYRVRNKRQNTARTSSNKQQESSASKKSSVTPLATKKARTDPKPTLCSSEEELPQSLTEPPTKNKDGTLTNGKSTSDDKSESSDESCNGDNSTSVPPSDEESGKSGHSLPTPATKTTTLRDIMHGILPDSRLV
jgi:hypothetical protein